MAWHLCGKGIVRSLFLAVLLAVNTSSVFGMDGQLAAVSEGYAQITLHIIPELKAYYVGSGSSAGSSAVVANGVVCLSAQAFEGEGQIVVADTAQSGSRAPLYQGDLAQERCLKLSALQAASSQKTSTEVVALLFEPAV